MTLTFSKIKLFNIVKANIDMLLTSASSENETNNPVITLEDMSMFSHMCDKALSTLLSVLMHLSVDSTSTDENITLSYTETSRHQTLLPGLIEEYITKAIEERWLKACGLTTAHINTPALMSQIKYISLKCDNQKIYKYTL